MLKKKIKYLKIYIIIWWEIENSIKRNDWSNTKELFLKEEIGLLMK